MIPTNPLTHVFLAIIAMIVLFFALTYFWIYPEAWENGQVPRDWAVTGAMFIVIFQFVGFIIWLILYIDGRKKGPGYSLIRERPKYMREAESSLG